MFTDAFNSPPINSECDTIRQCSLSHDFHFQIINIDWTSVFFSLINNAIQFSCCSFVQRIFHYVVSWLLDERLFFSILMIHYFWNYFNQVFQALHNNMKPYCSLFISKIIKQILVNIQLKLSHSSAYFLGNSCYLTSLKLHMHHSFSPSKRQ